MSCYEYADGSYTIPTREWPKFRTNFITRLNTFHAKVKQRAEDFTKEHNSLPKKLRHTSYTPLSAAVEWPHCTWLASPVRDVLKFNETTQKYTVEKETLKKRATSKSFSIEIDCTTLEMDNHSRCVSINVEENNKSFRAFEEHPVSTIFQECLDRVNWTRGTGGCLFYRSEYHCHEESDRIWEYGPKGARR